MNLRPRLSPGAEARETLTGWLLKIPAGSARHYRLSQLDDQLGVARRDYPWRPALNLSLRARASSRLVPGTWGFGLWNDPYGFSLGPGDTFLRLPALPQAAWFFYASAISYLSFRDDRPAQGLMAQVFQSPRRSVSLVRAALTLPVAPRAARRIMSRIINEDSAHVAADPTEWHNYRIRWTKQGTEFWTDDRPLLSSAHSPLEPLGFVLWIDNQYAAFDPQGHLRWGTEPNAEEAWLEVEDLRLESD